MSDIRRSTKRFSNRVENYVKYRPGYKGRMLSSSYTPVQGEPNHEVLMKELEKLFDLFNAGGKVTFKYETVGYIGEVQP